MSNLTLLLQTTLAGAEAQSLPESQVREMLLDLLLEDDQPIDTIKSARWLDRSPVTLKRWRSQGRGPTYQKDENGRVTYTPKWLREYSNRGIVT
jgi:hypothetical protein